MGKSYGQLGRASNTVLQNYNTTAFHHYVPDNNLYQYVKDEKKDKKKDGRMDRHSNA